MHASGSNCIKHKINTRVFNDLSVIPESTSVQRGEKQARESGRIGEEFHDKMWKYLNGKKHEIKIGHWKSYIYTRKQYKKLFSANSNLDSVIGVLYVIATTDKEYQHTWQDSFAPFVSLLTIGYHASLLNILRLIMKT